ncbi:MAG: cytochrome c biogenesis protein CcsA [Desulfovibrio sp.]|nr:cytochrome c biogenesis protein CcsA [Desulfovibrio sp.]
MISHEFVSLGTLAILTLSTILCLYGLLSRKQAVLRYGARFFWCALALQTLGLLFGFHKTFGQGLSGGAYMQLVAWFVGLAAILLSVKLKQQAAVSFAAPLCALLFALSLPYIERSIVLPTSLDASFYILHIATLFGSLALMAISFIVSGLFLVLERRIKRKERVKGFMEDMPALSLLDTINGFCILATFPCYTIGIVSGLVRSKPIFGNTFTGDPKELTSILVWLLLAFVFHNRLARSWTGKKPAITMLIVFLLSLFSFLIINTLMPSHHTFSLK